MSDKINISIIVPAYNEAGNLKAAVQGVIEQVQPLVHTYEIIIVNDGSTDNTGKIARELGTTYPQVRCIDRKKHRGFSYTIQEGIAKAKYPYFTQYHGDRDAATTYLKPLIENIGKADIISTYPQNRSSRSLLRQCISESFIFLINSLFGFREHYYNGGFICKTNLVRQLHLISKGFTLYAEIKIRLMKQGYRCLEIPFTQVGRKYGKSKALSFTNIISTIEMIFMLIKEYYFVKSK